MDQFTLFDAAPLAPPPRPTVKRRPARARVSDPATSHAAADSLTHTALRAANQAVLTLLRAYGPLTDSALAVAAQCENVLLSPSGLRTRRRELVDAGLAGDTGRRETLPSGRRSIVWTAITA